MPRAVATDAQRGLFLFLHYNLALHPVGFFLQQPHKMSELTPDGRNLRVRPSWTTSRLARAPKGWAAEGRPSYFDVAWRSLKPLIGTPAYDEAVERVHKKALALVLALPNPGQLTRARLVAAANEDTGAESVLDVVRLFQWLLPGLVVNVACMREQTLPS